MQALSLEWWMREAHTVIYSHTVAFTINQTWEIPPMLETSQKNSICICSSWNNSLMKPTQAAFTGKLSQGRWAIVIVAGRITGNGSSSTPAREAWIGMWIKNLPRIFLTVSSLRHFQLSKTIQRTEPFTGTGKEAQQIRIKLNHIRPYNARQAIHARQLRLNSLERQRWWRPLSWRFLSWSEKEWNSKHFKHERLCLEHQHCDGNLGGNHPRRSESCVKLGHLPVIYIGQGKRDDAEIFDPWAKTEGENHANGAIRPDMTMTAKTCNVGIPSTNSSVMAQARRTTGTNSLIHIL